MSKKVLSLALALTLLLSAVSCGFATVAAEAVAPDVLDRDNYTLQLFDPDYTAYADFLAEIMAHPNALTGLTPSVYNAVDENGGMAGDPNEHYHQYCPSGNAKYLSDQTITTGGNKVFFTTGDTTYLYADLGGIALIDQMLIAGDTNVVESNVGIVDIYASNDPATLVKAENVIVSVENGFFGAVITLKKAVSARYLAFHFRNGKDNISRISELGVYPSVPLSVDKGDYTLQNAADKATVYADYLRGVMQQKNLLTSASRTLYTAADFSASANFGNGSSAAALTDNNISGTTDGATTSSKVYWGNAETSYLVYDLGGVADVDQLLCAASVGEGTQSVTVYAAKALDSLISDENMIVDEANVFTGIFTLKNSVPARYVAFKVVGSSKYARVSELAVYSNSNAPLYTEKAAYTVTALNDYNKNYADFPYTEWLQSTLGKSNLLATAERKLYTDAALSATTGSIDSMAAFMYDGILPGINAAPDNAQYSSTDKKAFWNKADTTYLVYDLSARAQIESVLMTAGTKDGTQSITVYAGNSLTDLISEENVIIDEESIFLGVFDLKTPVEAQYVAFNFVGGSNYARVAELAVYGTKPYATTLLTGTEDADTVAAVVSKANYAANSTRYYYAAEADFGNTDAKKGTVTDNKKAMMDGVVPGVYGVHDTTNGDAYKGHWSNKYYLFLDLGGDAKVEQLLIAGPKLSGVEKDNLGSVTIWLGDDPTTLLSNPKMIVIGKNIAVGAIFTLNDAVTAKYAAVKIDDASWSRVSELGIYGTIPYMTDKDGYTVATVESPIFGNYMADLFANNTNLLKNATPEVYADADFVNGVNVGFHASSNKGSYLTNNNVPGITDTVGNANEKVFWQTSLAPYLFYDLGATADLTSILLAGSYPENVKYGNKLGDVKVYMGNDPATLVSDANLVASESIKTLALITPDAPKTARYVAIWFGGDSGYARVSELAVYGEYHAATPASLGAQVRNPESAANYALRFAFSIQAAGIGYASADSYARAELTTASKMVIDGTLRQVVDFGTVVSSTPVDADQLIADGDDETVLTVAANNLYNVENGVVTFTAVVTNIPSDHANTTLYARPYIAYLDGNGNVAYAYGDMLTRSVNDVIDSTDLI